MQKLRKMWASLVIGCVALAMSPAAAAPVDNPGFFFWQTGGFEIWYNQSAPISAPIAIGTGQWETDITSAGAITTTDLTMGAGINVGGSVYTAQVKFDIAATTGTLDAALDTVAVNTLARVRITGPGVGGSCYTPWFSLALTGFYTGPSPTAGSARLYSGGYVTVPPAASCAGQEAAINALFGFGPAGNGMLIQRFGAFADPAPTGS